MSLVSYGASSSEESEGEEETVQPKSQPTPKPKPGHQPTHQKKSLFSSLPPPKGLSSKLPPPERAPSKSSIGNTQLAGDTGTKKTTGLFSSLPPPKSTSGSSVRNEDASRTRKEKSKAVGLGVSGLTLPPPKKKAPVKINLPSLPDPDSDEEEEPVTKKPKQSKGVAGLFASLPKPRHASMKEANRILIPHTLTKRKPVEKPVKPAAKPAPNKPASVTSLVTGYDDDDDEEEDETNNTSSFFSLDKQDTVTPSVPDEIPSNISSSTAKAKGTVTMQDTRTSHKPLTSSSPKLKSTELQKTSKSVDPVEPPSQPEHSRTLAATESGISTEVDDTPATFHSPAQDTPLNFKPGATTVPVYGSMGSGDSDAPLSFRAGSQQQYGYYQQAGGSGYASGQYSEDYSYSYGAYNSDEQVTQAQPTQATQQEDSYLQDKEFQKMMGKHNRSNKEAIDIIDVNADEYLGPNPGTEWMLKSMTEEKEFRSNLKKEQLPSSQQRRKHQITYLAHQAKERELQLKNQWANNRMTRKQTQAKYGF
ncbi:proline-rich protein PRCC-like [Amphiura filiformis]|uniref:proline-rich protein PRCC-like n=1 Tax=Amphiura filiformis TaxID=82378 RepID=UPI003B211F85